MTSKKINGPYRPLMKPGGRDLKDFAKSIDEKLDITWGAARPAFFEVDGKWWVLFHGILKNDPTQHREGQRDVFLAPVRVTKQGSKAPRIEILFEDE